MKKYLYLLLSLLLLSSTSIAQPYKSIFGDTSTIWTCKYDALATNSIGVKTVKDTLVNGLWYKKLDFAFNGIPSGNNSKQLGLIREDTISGKAWYRSLPEPGFPPSSWYRHPSRDTIEKLIMDLNLQVGDTFYTNFFIADSLVIVDSVYYDTNNHKVIRFNKNTNVNGKMKFIEGIGTNLGISYMDSNALFIQPSFNPHGALICAFHDSIHVFISPITAQYNGNCLPPVSIRPLEKQQLHLYPNPSVGEFRIDIPTKKRTQITITNISGQVVYHKEVINKKLLTINLTTQPKGIYSIQLVDEQNSYISKLLLE